MDSSQLHREEHKSGKDDTSPGGCIRWQVGPLPADSQRESWGEANSQRLAVEAALGIVPTGVLPVVATSGSGFRTNISDEIFGVPQRAFLPLGVRPAPSLFWEMCPGVVKCLLSSWGPRTKFSIRWKRLASIARVSFW